MRLEKNNAKIGERLYEQNTLIKHFFKMNDYKNYYGALPLCIVPKTPSVTEYCNRNILRNTYLHAFLLFPASPLISNDNKPTTQNYFDLTFVSNLTITECKTNSINTQIKPFVPHLVLVSSHLTCTRQVHKQKHDYKHKKMESLLLFFYAYGCASLRFTRSLTPKASVVGVHAPCFRSLFQSEAKCEAVDTK